MIGRLALATFYALHGAIHAGCVIARPARVGPGRVEDRFARVG
jgi:hypothetical protein